MMTKDVNKSIRLYFDYTMKKHVNICGNVLLNIMHSLGFVLLLKARQLGKIFSGWVHDLDTGNYILLKYLFKVITIFDYFISGKTEFQTTQLNRARRTVQFERRPSQRYARRQSHVLRERQKYINILIIYILYNNNHLFYNICIILNLF